MLNNKPILLAGAVALFGSAAVLTKYLLSRQKTQLQREVDDETLIRFLKDLKSQSFTNFFLVASIIKNLEQDNFNQEQLETIMQQVMVEIENLFEAKQRIVLGMYPFSKEEIQVSIERSTNQTVKRHLDDFERLYTNCLRGIEPETNLTQETRNNFQRQYVIETIQAVLNISIRLIYQTCKYLREKMGSKIEITLQSPQFIQRIHEVGIIKAKRQILIEKGVTKFEPELNEFGEPNSPTQVFSKLTHHYKLQDNKFKEQVDKIEKKYEDSVVKFMKQDVSEEEANKIFQQLQDSFGKE